jgi:CBS domain-containing protein
MAKAARDVMTPDPACCTSDTNLVEVAKLMVINNCGEIPVIVAEGRNPADSSARDVMSQPVVTVREDAPLDQVVSTMEKHQLRRVIVVDRQGLCAGIIAQADVALTSREREVAHLVREVSRGPVPAERA